MNWLSKFVGFYFRKLKIIIQCMIFIRRIPNLKNPVSVYDKVQYRKLFGNHKFYALMTDKYKVREFVTKRIGDKYLIPLLGVFDRLSPEVFANLPDKFVIKCNNGCKWHKIVQNKSLLDVQETVRYFNRQCRRKYSRRSGERHYDFIEPKIVIEKLLDDNGEQPWEYDFYCYNGRNGFDCFISIFSPDGVQSSFAHFDRNWNLLETNFTDEQMKKYAKPKNFQEMENVARLLSADFDFVRVDLYNIAGTIYFGEITCTPGSGIKPIKNKVRERIRGEMWELAVDNRQLYQKREWIAD